MTTCPKALSTWSAGSRKRSPRPRRWRRTRNFFLPSRLREGTEGWVPGRSWIHLSRLAGRPPPTLSASGRGARTEMLHFELVTPEKLVRSEDVYMVVVPGSEGDFGVLEG